MGQVIPQEHLKKPILLGSQPAIHSKLSSCLFQPDASQPPTANSQAVYSSRTPASHSQQTLKLSIPAGRQPATHSKLCNLLLLDELVDTLRESEVKRGRTCQPVQWAEEILQVNIESNLLLHHQSKVQTYLSVTPPPRNSMLTCNISCFKGHPTHPTQH